MRRVALGVGLALSLLTGTVLAGLVLRMTLLPVTDTLRHADAIVVIGGGGPRIQAGDRLLRRSLAPRLLISVSRLGPGGSCPVSTDSVPLPKPSPTISCFRPSPYSTQGEARYIASRARTGAWSRVIVVTSEPQQPRARLRIARCFLGQVETVAVRPGVGISSWVGSVVYELGADVKAWTVQRSC